MLCRWIVRPIFFLALYIFDLKTIPNQICAYPDLVLKLLTGWPVVRFFQFLDSD